MNTPQPPVTSTPSPAPKRIRSLLDFPSQGMTRQQSSTFLAALTREMDLPGEVFDQTNQKNKEDIAAAVRKSEAMGILACRMHPDTRVTVSLFLFIASLCPTPGICVMWAYTLHRMHKGLPDLPVLTLEAWADLFPDGVPSEESYLACWDGQKGRAIGQSCDNGLDQPKNWE